MRTKPEGAVENGKTENLWGEQSAMSDAADLGHNRPLEGLKIVELGVVITGPLASCLLGELGAEVIKVEHPDGGDPFRSFLGGRYSPQFRAYNKNKKSVILDLSIPANQDKLRGLLRDADVLVDNFRPGVLDRLGLSETVLTSQNPRLIRCSICGFGTKGPYTERPSYDAVAQALSGMAGLFLDPERPRMSGPTVADNVTGMYAALGILAALHQRQRTGVGSRVDVNMLEAAIAFIPDSFAYADSGIEVTSTTRVAASQSFALVCADGKALALHLSSLPKFWEALVAAIGRPELRNDPRYKSRADRYRNYEALRQELLAVFQTRPRADWVARLEAADVPFAPIYEITEVAEDPQVRHLGTFYSMAASDGTIVRMTNCPIWFDGHRVAPRSAPPLLGEHTAAELLPSGDGG
jgi:crotonobetainyl-CoA:carnitine CoA-transferase CaiB-like acyl-CoA transferase